MINNKILRKYNRWTITILAIITFVITCWFQYYTYKKLLGYNVWYDFVTLFICGMCIFELIIRSKDRNIKWINNIIEYISKISLGIFFIHKIFLIILERYIIQLNTKRPIESFFLFIISFSGSVILIFVISKIKIIKEKILLVKD